MPNVFLCADLHFFHKNIIQYENRPFKDVEDMNRGLIQKWNQVVSKKDKVFILGDVSFGSSQGTTECVKQLNGYKTLVMGNHDRAHSVSWWQQIGLDVVIPYPILYRDKYLLSHEPPAKVPDDSYFYIYGHVHGDPAYPNHTNRSACVSIERLGYAPALFDDVISGKAYIH